MKNFLIVLGCVIGISIVGILAYMAFRPQPKTEVRVVPQTIQTQVPVKQSQPTQPTQPTQQTQTTQPKSNTQPNTVQRLQESDRYYQQLNRQSQQDFQNDLDRIKLGL